MGEKVIVFGWRINNIYGIFVGYFFGWILDVCDSCIKLLIFLGEFIMLKKCRVLFKVRNESVW